jgi:phage-related protein
MAARSFNPMLTRRAPAASAKGPARAPTRTQPRAAGVGVPRFAAATPARTAAPISQRNDRWEGEARRASTLATTAPASATPATRPSTAPAASSSAVAALRSPSLRPSAAAPSARVGPRGVRTVRTAHPSTGPPTSARPSIVFPAVSPTARVAETSALADVTSVGQPLSPSLRRRLESVFGTDLSAVRIHTGPAAQRAAERVHARAFTVGSHIYLNAGESSADVALMAHETAHAVQQSATLHAADPRGPPRSSSLTLSAAPRGMIQREEQADKGVLDYLGDAVDTAAGAVVEGFWYAVDTFAPQEIADFLHEVRNEGFWGILKKKIGGALDAVFATLKAQGGTTAKIATFFETLVAKAKPILAALAAGNCEPLFNAVKDLGDMLGQMAGDAWDKITTFLTPIGEWLQDVWQKFGAPVVDFLKAFASDTWDWITGIGKRLWDLTAPVRDFYSGAWTEIKNLLGFGEGGDEDGSGGLVGWITTTAGEVWDGIKDELKPVIEPIKQAAKAVNDLLPLNAILNLREKIDEWLDKATAMADNMDQPDDVAANQDLLREIILPGLQRAITTVRGKVTAASTWVTDAIGGLVGKVTDFLGTLAGNTWLSPFRDTLNWLSDEATELGNWATNKVVALFGFADNALVALSTWIEPVVKMLNKLLTALGDLMGKLGDLVLGPLLLVPKCIRDPIKDFIVTRILAQIPVFSQLIQLPDIWAKIQPAFRAVIVSVFRDGNLFAAAWTFFKTVLGLLGVPPQLVTNLIRNAAKAIRDVLKDPIGFLGNVLTAMKLGLLQFVDHIGKHLLDGAVNWLLSGVKGAGIKIPEPFTITLRNVLDLVFQVLDLTKEKIFQRIEKKKGKEVADKVRKIVAAGEKVLEWVTILFNEGPAGLWAHLKTELGNLWSKLLDTVIDYLIGKIVQQATIWVTKTLASGGLSVILDALKAIYDALQVIAQYLKQLLEVANSVCEGIIDIAKGVLNKAADIIELAAARLVPAVLAFLARTLGIGDLPVVIGEGIQKVRTMVEGAIDKLIEKTFAAIDWAKQKVKDAVDTILQWWKNKKGFTNADGESHTLKFQGEAATASLVVESTPRPLVTFLADYESTKKPDAAEKEVIKQIRTKVTKIENIKSKGGTRSRSSFTPEEGVEIQQLFLDIVGLLEKLRGDGKPPETTVTWSAPDEDGVSMTAEPLSLNPGKFAGSQPSEESKLWQKVTAKFPGKYVRGHLLNHHVHGPGTKKNLTPITIGANNRMERLGESAVKKAVLDEKKTLRFVVRVTAFHSKTAAFPEAAKLPAQVHMSAEEIKKNKSGGWDTTGSLVSETIDSPLPT